MYGFLVPRIVVIVSRCIELFIAVASYVFFRVFLKEHFLAFMGEGIDFGWWQ